MFRDDFVLLKAWISFNLKQVFEGIEVDKLYEAVVGRARDKNIKALLRGLVEMDPTLGVIEDSQCPNVKGWF